MIELNEKALEAAWLATWTNNVNLSKDAVRTAITAYLQSSGLGSAGGVEVKALLAQVASIICDETCGLTSACKSREAAKALFDKGYLISPALIATPKPEATEGVVKPHGSQAASPFIPGTVLYDHRETFERRGKAALPIVATDPVEK